MYIVYTCTCTYITLYVQTHEDPNLGKDWFHGSISREEVLELLTHSKRVLWICTCILFTSCSLFTLDSAFLSALYVYNIYMYIYTVYIKQKLYDVITLFD